MEQEIKVVKSELSTQITELGRLFAGTPYKNRSAPITAGYGEMADTLNEMFAELQSIEAVMLEVLEQTKEALIKANVAFDEADLALGQMMGHVGNTGIL